MPIRISPLELRLDHDNPRFVVIPTRTQETIRRYLVTYEDVCQLAKTINASKGLLLGERIVAVENGDRYVVMEGNRRTCALQMLINPDLIPEGTEHIVPAASSETLANIKEIEVDVAPDRDYALNLMARRHIEGVKQWKPLAKKRFFANLFDKGSSIAEIVRRTGVSRSTVKKDIIEYKLLLTASREYKKQHPDFEEDFTSYKIEPFLRLFSAKQKTESGATCKPNDILRLTYGDDLNTISGLPDGVFERVLAMVFEATIVDGSVSTRQTLYDVPGLKDVIEAAIVQLGMCESSEAVQGNDTREETDESGEEPHPSEEPNASPQDSSSEASPATEQDGDDRNSSEKTDNSLDHSAIVDPEPSGDDMVPGGEPPAQFFENISWQPLDSDEPDHEGLRIALHELHNLSTRKLARSPVYSYFPVATGMLLRSAYEQALILQLKKQGRWNELLQRDNHPMLKNIETFINNNLGSVFPDPNMRRAFKAVTKSNYRDFLNANVHDPGLIRTTPKSLEALAAGGLLGLIQKIVADL